MLKHHDVKLYTFTECLNFLYSLISGVAINDSPVGLAAYILEKFLIRTKTDDGGLKEHFSYTNLLDNVMIYWWTKTATTSFRLYAETFNKKQIGMIM